MKALAKVPLLSGLSQRELAHVLALGDEVEFFPGKVVVEIGDLARDFYMILTGKARLTVPGKKNRTLGPGDYFGEMAVLDGGPRTATIVAQTHVSALRIDRKDFLSLLHVNGSISRKILIEMSKRVRASEAAAGHH
jgi:CRP-like cAMP-binding protein